MAENKYSIEICIHFHYKDWFFDIVIPKENKNFIFSFHFFFINISIVKNVYDKEIPSQIPQMTAEQWDEILKESEEIKMPSDEKIDEMWENIQKELNNKKQITMKKITVKTIYLISGMPNQGKTTITTKWVDFVNRGEIKPAQYMMLDGIMLNYLNHKNNTNLTGEQFSVLELIKTYDQQQLDELRGWILKEIELFLQSDKTDLYIDGWLLDFYQDIIFEKYNENNFINKIKVFNYCCYVNNVKYLNDHLNDILPMMGSLTDDLEIKNLSYLSEKTNYHYFEDINCGNQNQQSLEKYNRLKIYKSITIDKTMLDIGCNTGYNSIHTASHAKHVIGIDISAEAVKIAASYNNLVYKHNNLDFICGDFYSMSEDKQFDVILAASILHYQVDTITEFIDKCYILLAPGGILILECGIIEEKLVENQIRGVNYFTRSDNITCIYATKDYLITYLCRNFKLIYEGPSVDQAGDKVPRFVFHFRKN